MPSQLLSVRFISIGEIFAYHVTSFHILSLLTVDAGCAFVAGIDPPETRM